MAEVICQREFESFKVKIDLNDKKNTTEIVLQFLRKLPLSNYFAIVFFRPRRSMTSS